MSTPFKIGLVCLFALALAAGVTYLLLDEDDASSTHNQATHDGIGHSPTSDEPGYLKGEPDRIGRADSRDAPVLASGEFRPGTRPAQGPSYGSPEERAKKLRELLNAPEIRWEDVARILSITNEPLSEEVRGILLNRLQTGPQYNRVLKAFANARDEALVQGVIALYEDASSSARAKKAALQALWQMPAGEPNEISKYLESQLSGEIGRDGHLLNALARRGGKESARAMIAYVQGLENPQTMPPYLLRAIPPSDDEEVRKIIRDGLNSDKTSPAALQTLLRMVANPAMRGFGETLVSLDRPDQSMDVRRQLYATMSDSGDSAAIEHLAKRAVESGHMGTMALEALGRVKAANPEGRQSLMNLLERAPLHANPPKAKEHILLALGSLGHRPAIPAMVGALEDSNTRVQIAAIRGLGRMGAAAQEHLPTLARVFTEGNGAMQQRVAVAVGQIGGPKALDMMKSMESTEGIDESVRRSLRVSIRSLQSRIAQRR